MALDVAAVEVTHPDEGLTQDQSQDQDQTQDDALGLHHNNSF